VQSLERFIDRYGCPFLYAECRTYYGRVLFENGDWDAAEPLLIDAISMSRGVFAAPHAFASGTLAELRLAQGRREDAVRVLRGVEGRVEAAAAVASVHLQQGEPSAAAAVLRRRLAATSPDRLDVAAAIELLGEAELALRDSRAAIERGRALVALGAVNDCHLIVAHGERLLGHALASTDVPAACAHLETALAAFAHAGIPAPRRRGCCSLRCSGAATVRWPGPRRGRRCRSLRIWAPAATRTPPPRCCGTSA
jgi:tetratricopeptide (TPR) repeat protein